MLRRIPRNLDISGFSPNFEFCCKLMDFSQLTQPPERFLPLVGNRFDPTSVSS